MQCAGLPGQKTKEGSHGTKEGKALFRPNCFPRLSRSCSDGTVPITTLRHFSSLLVREAASSAATECESFNPGPFSTLETAARSLAVRDRYCVPLAWPPRAPPGILPVSIFRNGFDDLPPVPLVHSTQ
ncbi:hypothetical protein R1flu_009758 [Riccia fluitans]|uniref:Uncharacterized protein n=1 Tax=Riccia fluitans TaxID=41844 RepID=A0ABD1Z325_9MARC